MLPGFFVSLLSRYKSLLKACVAVGNSVGADDSIGVGFAVGAIASVGEISVGASAPWVQPTSKESENSIIAVEVSNSFFLMLLYIPFFVFAFFYRNNELIYSVILASSSLSCACV